jgi:hypothetical protein
MVESLTAWLHLFDSVTAAPLDERLLPALVGVLVLGVVAVFGGVWIAKRLRGPVRGATDSGRTGEDPQAACRLHEWIRMDDGDFVCLRCSYRAGSSLTT